MKKYLTLFALSWQKQLEVRSDFFFERTRSFCILLSLTFLWTTLLKDRPSLLGYSKSDLISYVFLMTLLRAWVLACVTDRIPMEISKGKLSDVLLRPISYLGYWATQDAANKVLSLISAVFEVSILALFIRVPLSAPTSALHAVVFVVATFLAMILYFQMSYMLGVIGFWTAQSWGPRFCFEVILEFCAGAYFPIDLLPAAAQKVLNILPFSSLIFFPISVYLGRASTPEIATGILRQLIWIAILAIVTKSMWKAGLRKYAAEGV